MKKQITAILMCVITLSIIVYAAMVAKVSNTVYIPVSYNAVANFSTGTKPWIGLPVGLGAVCKEKVAPTYRCNLGDTYNPIGVLVTIENKTNSQGLAKVTFKYNGLQSDIKGTYHYTVCNWDTEINNCEGSAQAVGDFVIR